MVDIEGAVGGVEKNTFLWWICNLLRATVVSEREFLIAILLQSFFSLSLHVLKIPW